MFVDSWKLVADKSGKTHQKDDFVGQEKMTQKTEQMYLGDIISCDGKQDKNIEARKNKGIGIIAQIMSMLESTVYGKYYFEVAMVLRNSLFLSSVLLNSEAWINLSKNNIRKLEQVDEMLLSKILDCNSNTSNVVKYLELGAIPIRYEIIKRRLVFFQYLLKQEKSSMIRKVLDATIENPSQNDFVVTCQEYMKVLNIDISFDEIQKMSNWKFKNMVKERVSKSAFEYLMNQKENQKKAKSLKYKDLKIQDYLVSGLCNKKAARLIFRARSETLEIKSHRKWKYEDVLCVGCKKNEETGEEIMNCNVLNEDNKDDYRNVKYDWFYSKETEKIVVAGRLLQRNLKEREKRIGKL